MAVRTDPQGRPMTVTTTHQTIIGVAGPVTDSVLALCEALGHEHKKVARIEVTPTRIIITEYVHKEQS